MPFSRILFVVALVGLASGCTGTANTGASPTDVLSLQSSASATVSTDGSLKLVQTLPAPAGTSDGTEQLLSPNDILDVSFYQVPTLNSVVQVDSMGRVSLPLVGVVKVAGKSVRQLEQELIRLYGTSYLQSPNITVFLKESARQRVTVDGEVGKPGLHPVTAQTTLLDAIALAGGFRDIADQKKVFVFREIGNSKLVANYSVEDIRSGRLQNPRIYGGDVIMVFTSRSRVAVNNLKEALGMAATASRAVIIP